MQLWQLVVSIVVIVLGTPSVFIVWGVSGGFVLAIVFGSSVAKRCGRCFGRGRGGRGDDARARAPRRSLLRCITCGCCGKTATVDAGRHDAVESLDSAAASSNGEGEEQASASASSNSASSGGRRRFLLFGKRQRPEASRD